MTTHDSQSESHGRTRPGGQAPDVRLDTPDSTLVSRLDVSVGVLDLCCNRGEHLHPTHIRHTPTRHTAHARSAVQASAVSASRKKATRTRLSVSSVCVSGARDARAAPRPRASTFAYSAQDLTKRDALAPTSGLRPGFVAKLRPRGGTHAPAPHALAGIFEAVVMSSILLRSASSSILQLGHLQAITSGAGPPGTMLSCCTAKRSPK